MSEESGNKAEALVNIGQNEQRKPIVAQTTGINFRDKATAAKMSRFLNDLRNNGGQTMTAMRTSGLGKVNAYRLANENPEFAQQWEDALTEAHEMLVTEAHRQAMQGNLRYITDKRGRRKAIRVKSERLLDRLITRGDARSNKKRLIEVGRMALEAVREKGMANGMTEEQIRDVQNGIIAKFDTVKL